MEYQPCERTTICSETVDGNQETLLMVRRQPTSGSGKADTAILVPIVYGTAADRLRYGGRTTNGLASRHIVALKPEDSSFHETDHS